MDGNLTGADRPTHIDAMAVSDNYFRLLGANPFKGRLFMPEDGIPWMSVNSIISYGAWVRLFGSDPNVLGRRVKLDYDDYVVVGVLPPTFHHPGLTLQGEPDFYITGSFRGGAFPQNPSRNLRMIPAAIGRIRAGLTLDQAKSRLYEVAREVRSRYPHDYPAAAKWMPRISSLRDSLASGSHSMLLIMSGAAIAVLLISCTTIANLFLAHTSEKRKEIAIRIAIGAKPVNVIRQLMLECLLLSASGSVLGVFFAVWATPLLVRYAPFSLPHINAYTLDRAAIAYSALACVAMAVLSSLLPALYSLRLNLAGVMREASSNVDGSRFSNRSRSVLVVIQVAFSIMLMSGTGLLVKTMWNVLQIDPGFNAHNLLVGSIWLPPPGNPAARKYETPSARSLFADQLLQRLQSMPGVESAALGTGDAIPLIGWNSNQFQVQGIQAADGKPYFGQITGISEDYLSAVGAHVISGRVFTKLDRTSSGVALVNRTLADRIWKGQNPI
jgi:predicted permease